MRTPPLENGDRLTRDEFERRYEASPESLQAELIEGVVYLRSPVRHDGHGKQHAAVITWLGHFGAQVPQLEVSDNATVRMDQDNEPQPDGLLRLPERLGGRSRIDYQKILDGSPELVVEVASSSASYDTGPKKHAYRRNGVQEYLIWRVFDGALDWFILEKGVYERLAPGADRILRSRVFPGLWLDPEALLDDRMARVLEVLDLGLASHEHLSFRARLEAASTEPGRN